MSRRNKSSFSPAEGSNFILMSLTLDSSFEAVPIVLNFYCYNIEYVLRNFY